MAWRQVLVVGKAVGSRLAPLSVVALEPVGVARGGVEREGREAYGQRVLVVSQRHLVSDGSDGLAVCQQAGDGEWQLLEGRSRLAYVVNHDTLVGAKGQLAVGQQADTLLCIVVRL